MLAKSEPPYPSTKILKLAKVFKILGWSSFWGQIGFAAFAGLILLLALIGRPDSGTGIGIGIFWAVFSFLFIFPATVFSFRYTLIAKSLLHAPEAHWHPRKSEVDRFLRIGTLIGLIGIILALIGAEASIAVLVAKTVSQPPGMAITDPSKLVRALDVYVVLTNLNLIAAHLFGTIAALWLLAQIHVHH